MNPLADLVELPVWQFLLVYASLGVFAAIFLAYLRWETSQVEEAGPAPDVAPADAAELARGRTAARAPEVSSRLIELKLIVAPASQLRMRAVAAAVTALFVCTAAYKLKLTLDRGKPVVGLVIAFVATLASGLALALAPLWTTSRGAAALGQRGRAP